MNQINSKIKPLRKLIQKHPILFLILSTLLITIGAAYIFYLRYPYPYTHSSFYAEDGTILSSNIYVHGVVRALTIRFNGYLVVGLYGLIDIGMLFNRLLGNGFLTMGKVLAVVSYLFLGFVCTLPWLLFRRKLGSLVAILTVLLLTVFPLGGADDAVIGEIGNLKFAFFFVAVLLLLFRNDKQLCKRKWLVTVVDLSLLFCVLTNFFTLVLLPLGLVRYKKELIHIWKNKRLPKLEFDHYSFIVLAVVSFVYAVIIYLKGIPNLAPFYPLAKGPIHAHALLPLLYRGSLFGLLFPFGAYPPSIIMVALLIFVLIVGWRARERKVLLFLTITVLINYVGLILTRPGITTAYLDSPLTDDAIMFFYAGTLVFTFAVAYGLRHRFNALKPRPMLAATFMIVMYFFLAFPNANFGLADYNYYKYITPLEPETIQLCETGEATLHIPVYPLPGQTVVISRQFACNYRK